MEVGSISKVQPTGPGTTARQPGGGIMKASMDAAAETLGLSRNDLRSSLQSGNTLKDLANDAGVSTDDLKAAMSEAISSAAPPQIAERANRELDGVISGRRPPPPPRPQQTDVESAVSALAEALETSEKELKASIENGSVAELFETAGLDAESGILVDIDL